MLPQNFITRVGEPNNDTLFENNFFIVGLRFFTIKLHTSLPFGNEHLKSQQNLQLGAKARKKVSKAKATHLNGDY